MGKVNDIEPSFFLIKCQGHRKCLSKSLAEFNVLPCPYLLGFFFIWKICIQALTEFNSLYLRLLIISHIYIIISFHHLQLRNTQSYCTDNECLTDCKYWWYFIRKELNSFISLSRDPFELNLFIKLCVNFCTKFIKYFANKLYCKP